MRRRNRTVARLVAASLLSLVWASTGNASLENDCYFTGAYFDSTYYAADYFDETCSGGDPPSPVAGGNKHKNLFRFPGIWR